MKQNTKNNETILAIDSSCGTCSVAIWNNGSITAYCEELSGALQAKKLIMMVEDALNIAKIDYCDLSKLACTVGPGSFTGIRIGLASARGIGFAANIPVCGYNSLQVMAFGMKDEEMPILASLNAGKGEMVYQYFNTNMEASCPPTLAASKNLATGYPRADLLAQLAAMYPGHAVEPLPFYVRPPDAKLPSSAHAAN